MCLNTNISCQKPLQTLKSLSWECLFLEKTATCFCQPKQQQLQCPCPGYICPHGTDRENDRKGYPFRSEGFRRTPTIARASVIAVQWQGYLWRPIQDRTIKWLPSRCVELVKISPQQPALLLVGSGSFSDTHDHVMLIFLDRNPCRTVIHPQKFTPLWTIMIKLPLVQSLSSVSNPLKWMTDYPSASAVLSDRC